MSYFDIIGVGIGVVIIVTVLWKILRHGTVKPTLDVDPDDRMGTGY